MSFWSEAYRDRPPWDIGRAQPAFVRLSTSGRLPKGRLLDAGCGSGENALFFAAKGYAVVGIDLAPRAIEIAEGKARERKIPAEFRVADALDLPRLGRAFDVVIDSGLFHTFTDDERPVYASGVARVLREGGVFAMLCFSEREPTDWGGPRRVTREEIRATFGPHLTLAGIRDVRFGTRLHRSGGGFAYLTVGRKGSVTTWRSARAKSPAARSRIRS